MARKNNSYSPTLRIEVVREEEGGFTIRNPQAHFATCGDTLEEAFEAFAEALQIFTETLAEYESTLGRRQKKSLALLRNFIKEITP